MSFQIRLCSLALLAAASLFGSSSAATAAFYANANISSTDGNHIQAHSGAIIQDQNALAKGNNVWYWFGQNNSISTSGDYFLGVPCYRTTDFTSWDYMGLALTPIANSSISTTSVVERPKVLYNHVNKEYVMWFHSDNYDYSLAQVGIATSKTIQGPYKYVDSFYPLGHQSRDMTVWQDPDTNEGFLIFATDNNANLAIASLNAAYTNTTAVVYNFTNVYWEAPGVLKRNGIINLIYSRQAGWTPDPNGYMAANNMSGPWTKPIGLAPSAANTYLTQNGYDVTINGTKKTTYVYQGDRWNGNELYSSTYAFMPLVEKNGNLSIHYTGGWTLDAETGEWADLNFTSIHAAKTNSSNLVTCPKTCAGGKAANMTNASNFQFEWTGAAGEYVLQIQYSYDGSANAFSQLRTTVNGAALTGLALLESGQNNYIQQAALPLKLSCGSKVEMKLVHWDGAEVLIQGVHVFDLLPGSSIVL